MATHRDSNNMVSTTQGKSGAHSQSLKLNVTPASDVIAALFRYRYLRRSIGHVKSHAPNPSVTAAEILVSIALGEGDLLDLPCKRRAGERCDLIIVKVQLTATHHQACQCSCDRTTDRGRA